MRRIRDGLFHRYRKLTFRPKIIEREIAGEQIRFLIGDLFGEAAYGLEHTAWPEIDWIKKHCVRPGDTVLDCGANHGFLTVLFAKWVGPTGTVHAFEPSAHNMAILKENLRLNSVSNVVCHQVAVGGTDGTVSISLHPNASIVLNTETDQSLEKVSLVRLDDVLKAETPNFVKLDIEGFEHEALRGASRVLSRIPNLDLELHVSSYKDKLAGLRGAFDMIKLDCYSLFIQTEVDGPIVPFQKEFHTWEALANREVVHLFCVSKPDCPRR
jgi:FkbM family methyltransferase